MRRLQDERPVDDFLLKLAFDRAYERLSGFAARAARRRRRHTLQRGRSTGLCRGRDNRCPTTRSLRWPRGPKSYCGLASSKRIVAISPFDWWLSSACDYLERDC